MDELAFDLLEDHETIDTIKIADGSNVRKDDRVVLRPRAGGDIFDIALAGKIGIVEAIEQDYEGRVHLAIVLEDDPGRDLGMMRQPGHRFFFSPEEVGAISAAEQKMEADA